ncbi:hemojuvelin isoform X2 [Polyodon spathula]|nr:hemojuvelin isoform X2 [Polyodon spathula]XP_041099068.1 hemojuvelin isoform X2 [Polyodon spathula]XP_041099069.1 hemojuvelin isoform X2 [Polyodon spathula]
MGTAPASSNNTLQTKRRAVAWRLLLTLLFVKQASAQCRILRCNSEFVAATLNLEGGAGGEARYCSSLRSYALCTRRTSRACRGDLAYHSAAQGIEDLMIQHRCPKTGPTSRPRPQAPLSSHDGPPAGDSCNYNRSFYFREGRLPSYFHCGVFGDPHIRTFQDDFQTCRVKGAWPLIDNNYLYVQVTSAHVAKGSNATALTEITIIFKNFKECIDQRIYQAEINNVPAAFNDGSTNGGNRRGGNSLTIGGQPYGQHIEIRAVYIGTTIIVRQSGGFLAFSIRTPQEVAHSFPEEQDLQLCLSGCPSSHRLPRYPPLSSASSLQAAKLKCGSELPKEDIYFQACVFDVVTTGDTNVTRTFAEALEDARTLIPDVERLHLYASSTSKFSIALPTLWLIFFLVTAHL